MVHDSSAAALAITVGRIADRKPTCEHNILVFSMGGGTLEASLVSLDEGIVEVSWSTRLWAYLNFTRGSVSVCRWAKWRWAAVCPGCLSTDD